MTALIVGCGRIAGGYNTDDDSQVLSHVVAYRRAGVDVVGCVDLDTVRARAFAARWDIAEYGTDLAGMLRALRPDVVSDCTPPASRAAVVGAALAAPSVRTVIAEKPFGADGTAARALAAACAGSGKRVLVNHHRAYDPCYRAVERWLADGRLGRVQWLVGHAYGGALGGLSHVLERAVAMLGPVGEAQAIAPAAAAEPGDDAVAFQARFDGGVQGVFLPLARGGFAGVELDLIGTLGRLRIVDSERRVEWFEARASGQPGCDDLRLLAAAPADLPAPDWQALRHVVAAALDPGAPALCPPARAAEVVAVIDRVRRDGAYRRVLEAV